MTPDDLDHYLEQIGFTVERLTGTDNNPYSVIRGISITRGSLAGKVCNVAIHRPAGDVYVMPSAVHVQPALLPMDTNAPYSTQQSGVGPEWQYWSRRFDRAPTPKNIWTHVLTVLGEQ